MSKNLLIVVNVHVVHLPFPPWEFVVQVDTPKYAYVWSSPPCCSSIRPILLQSYKYSTNPLWSLWSLWLRRKEDWAFELDLYQQDPLTPMQKISSCNFVDWDQRMNEIVKVSLHRKFFHSFFHQILHEEGPDQENRKQREGAWCVGRKEQANFFRLNCVWNHWVRL